MVRQQWERSGVGNLEAVELGLREALLKDGRQLLQNLLEECSAELPENTSFPGEKHHSDRSRKVETLLGPVPIRRDYFYNPSTGHGRLPLDQALGLIDGSSPGLVRLASRAAARCGYQAASQDLEALAAIKIDSRQIQRIVQQSGPIIGQQLLQGSCVIEKPIPIMYVEVDGTGVPMMPQELAGRKGKQPDGSSKTREVKLGCVFTQTTTDEEGNPLRDHQSTTYMGSFESAKSFGLKIRNEARRRGIGSAQVVVFLGDGAAWVWELARLNFPGAVCILDFYHALERLNDLCKSLYLGNPHWISTMQDRWYDKMENDGIEDVILSARRRLLELDSAIEPAIEGRAKIFL